jgi:hypothetical protein
MINHIYILISINVVKSLIEEAINDIKGRYKNINIEVIYKLLGVILTKIATLFRIATYDIN